MTSQDNELTDSGALKTLFFLKAVNRYGMEHREQIRQILETLDFQDFNEAELWQTLEKMIVSSNNVKQTKGRPLT